MADGGRQRRLAGLPVQLDSLDNETRLVKKLGTSATFFNVVSSIPSALGQARRY